MTSKRYEFGATISMVVALVSAALFDHVGRFRITVGVFGILAGISAALMSFLSARKFDVESVTLVERAQNMRVKILVRKNLKMTAGKLAAQCVHAALGLFQKDPQQHWSCVVSQVGDQKFAEAVEAHPDGYVVRDAGYTEIAAGNQTCLAFYEQDPREMGANDET